MKAAGLDTRDVIAVLKWVAHHPNPSIEVMEAEVAQQAVTERDAKIAKHRAALARLEAEV